MVKGDKFLARVKYGLKQQKDYSSKLSYLSKLLQDEKITDSEKKQVHKMLGDHYRDAPNHSMNNYDWRAAEHYRDAGDIPRAVKAYESYLDKRGDGDNSIHNDIVSFIENESLTEAQKMRLIRKLKGRRQGSSSELTSETSRYPSHSSSSLSDTVTTILSSHGWRFLIFSLTFILALFFFSFNFTGYSVVNLFKDSSNLLGFILLGLGIVGLFLIFRKR